MNVELTNGTFVNRLYPGESEATELIAVFQYDGDAILFAKVKSNDDAARNFACDYIITNTYNGKVTIIRSKVKKK